MKRLFAILIVIVFLFAAGCQPVSITDAKVDDYGELILYMSDGTSINAGVVKGEDGKDGKNGTDGLNGVDGKDGADGQNGVGIAKAAVNDSGDLMIRLTDDTLINAGQVAGKNGKDGRDGADGRDGRDGIDGVDGKDGRDGADGRDGRDGIDGVDGKDGKDAIDHTLTSTSLFSADIQTYDANNDNDFIYEDNDSTHLKKYTGNSTHVSIQSGVTTIGAGAFSGNTFIVSVEIPDTVLSIEAEAFKDCTALESVILPKSSLEIGVSAFENSGLSSVVHLYDRSTINQNAFANTKISAVVVNDPTGNSAKIMSNAFANCPSLRRVWLISSNTIFTLSENIFSGCGSIEIYSPLFFPTIYSNMYDAAYLGLKEGSTVAYSQGDDSSAPK
ncbi:MAG: leucine-rich repeat protein [Clostridia bacterium]|nr:leucine-rich repeat protein [Clostridia bacterium]